jgi:hypothetical protein
MREPLEFPAVPNDLNSGYQQRQAFADPHVRWTWTVARGLLEHPSPGDAVGRGRAHRCRRAEGQRTLWVVYGDGVNPGHGTLSSPPGPDFQEGANHSKKTGYQAPCPPHGTTHHYRLTVRAIDFPMEPGGGGGELSSGYTPAQMEAAINSGHGIGVVNQSQIDATYARP